VPQHCAGALILHKKLGRPNWRIPFAGTLGLLYARRLHLDARVASCARVQAYCFRSRLVSGHVLFQVTSTRLTNQRTNGRETSI